MADNYLGKRQEDYEKRKAEWIRKQKHLGKKTTHVTPPQKPDDEAL
ncbi:MAG: dehydrogenase [Bacteroidales bacterium]|nr:dehydrogenase [Bacteroidales bacterium]